MQVCQVSNWTAHTNKDWEADCHSLKSSRRILVCVHFTCTWIWKASLCQAAVCLGRMVAGGGKMWHRWVSCLGARGRRLMTRCCLAGWPWRKNDKSSRHHGTAEVLVRTICCSHTVPHFHKPVSESQEVAKRGKDRLSAADSRRVDGDDAMCCLPTCYFRARGWEWSAHADTVKKKQYCKSKAFCMLN